MTFCTNGKLQDKELSVILSSLSQTFLGCSPFTTILAKNGRFYFLDYHMERLEKSVDFFYPNSNWHNYKKDILSNLKSINGSGEYLKVRIHIFPKDSKFLSLVSYEPYEVNNQDIKLAISCMRKSPSLLPSYIKNGSYMEVFIDRDNAKYRGFDDVLFMDDKDIVKECTTSNIFFSKDGVVKTPALTGSVLDGVTRRIIISLLKKSNVSIHEDDYTYYDLINSDNIWITNSLFGICNVCYLEDRRYSTDCKINLLKLYQEFREKNLGKI